MTQNQIATFVMHGARDAMDAGLVHIEQQIIGIEQAVDANPGLAFDLSKTLVESACRTVLNDRSVEYSKDDNLPTLFNAVADVLQFLPPTASDSSEVRKSLLQTLNGLKTAILGICELRNQCGFASHGSDNARPAMEEAQAKLAAEAADTIVGFLHRMHRQDRTPALKYEDNLVFNESVDEAFGPIRVFESNFRASEVLFELEPNSYRIHLAEFESELGSSESELGESSRSS